MINIKKRLTAFAIATLLSVIPLISGCTSHESASVAFDAVEIIEVASVETPFPDFEPAVQTAQPSNAAFPVNEPTGEANEIVVATVDEFLAALGPDRTIYLNPGRYDLTAAKDYGKTPASAFYEWTEVYDGYGLTVHGVQNLNILGHSANDVEIVTAPRYANVIGFDGCTNISVCSITAGHTEGAGTCSGAVLHFLYTDTVTICDCDLYGCGTLGVDACHSDNMTVQNCTIRECSQGVLNVDNCRNVLFDHCRMLNCGDAVNPAFYLLNLSQAENVGIVGCSVEDNLCQGLLYSGYCKNVQLLGSSISGNTFSETTFMLARYSPVVEGCAFIDNTSPVWYADALDAGSPVQAISKAGEMLFGDDLAAMQQAEVTYEAPTIEPATPEATVTTDGMREIYATGIDEFLAAIASDTTVYLAAGTYDLYKAESYGAAGTDGYYWEDIFDGPGLIVNNVKNFHIVGDSSDKVFLNALPRYANVLTFRNCENVSITGATLGHREAPGECAGGVLRFEQTDTIDIRDCKLFGCGILGVDAMECHGITVTGTEIYDCSQGAVAFYCCRDVKLTDCNIHDCGEPTFSVNNCSNVTNDGKEITETVY